MSTDKSTDYVLAVKENQKNLYAEISEYFEDEELWSLSILKLLQIGNRKLSMRKSDFISA